MMAFKTYTNWLITEKKKDIFGFEKHKRKDPEKKNPGLPVKRLNLEILTNYMANHKVGIKKGRVKFVNEAHWGFGTGSMRTWIGTGMNVMIDKQCVDLLGNPRWITKRIYQINQEGMGGHEEAIANELLEQMELIDKQPLDSPKNDFEHLENLVATMATTMQRTAREIFVYEGIKKVDDSTYIIRFGVRGHGIEAPDQKRIEENQTIIHYDKKAGIIRLMNYNIESPIGQHLWEHMPTDTDLYFMPTQDRDEIIETIANTMHWY